MIRPARAFCIRCPECCCALFRRVTGSGGARPSTPVRNNTLAHAVVGTAAQAPAHTNGGRLGSARIAARVRSAAALHQKVALGLRVPPHLRCRGEQQRDDDGDQHEVGDDALCPSGFLRDAPTHVPLVAHPVRRRLRRSAPGRTSACRRRAAARYRRGGTLRPVDNEAPAGERRTFQVWTEDAGVARSAMPARPGRASCRCARTAAPRCRGRRRDCSPAGRR